MSSFFLVVSTAWAQQHDGHTDGLNTVACARTTDGRTVCAYTTLLEFPDLLVGRRVTVVELSPADFPTPDPPAGFRPATA